MNNNDKWSINYSWSQPYTNWNYPVSSVDKELAVIEAIDNIVNSMERFPEAEAIIQKVRNGL